MKNNFITKIIGATLAFAMMIGGAVGINAAKQAKEVNADSYVWQKMTSTSEFVNGTTLLVTQGSYYLDASQAATGNTPRMASLTLSNGLPTLTADSTKCLTVTTYQTGLRMYGPGGTNYLYTNTSNNGTRIGTSATNGSLWTIENGPSAGEFYLKSNANRYLSRYGTTDFRSYTSTGTNANLVLYKLVSTSGQEIVEATSMSISPNGPISVLVGDTVTFTPTLNGGSGDYEKTINWVSSNTSVSASPANSEDGEQVSVPVLAVGSTTITGTVVNPGSASASITINAKEVSSIAVTTVPTKTTYSEGESFDPSGMVVTATYSDSSTANVTSGCTFAPDPLTEDTTEVTISYGGKTATQAITVNQITDVTFNYGTDNSTNLTLSKSGISLEISNGDFDTNGDSCYKVYKTATLDITSGVRKISKIIFTCTANGSAKYGPGSFGEGAPNGYAFEENGNKGTWSGSATSVSFTASSNQVRITKIVVYLEPTTPTIVLDKTSVSLKAVQSASATVEATVYNVDNPTYSWTSDSNVTLLNADTNVVTIKPNTNVAANSTVTLTVGNTTPELTATVSVNITLPDPGETAETAFTVAQAIAHIDEAGDDENEYFATGIVSRIVTAFNSEHGNITYDISSDGSTESAQLRAYRGRGFNGDAFSSEDDIEVGATVIIKGKLTKYGTTYEFAEGNELASYTAAPRFTVSFNSLGGSEIQNQSIKNGACINPLPTPTKAKDTVNQKKFTFEGWYTSANPFEEQNRFTTSTPVTSNLTLFAKYNETNYYVVTFNTNGGNAIDPQEVDSGNTVVMPDNPTKASDSSYSYTFEGWYKNVGLTESFDASQAITSNLILYAKYTEEAITNPGAYLNSATSVATIHATESAAENGNAHKTMTKVVTENSWTISAGTNVTCYTSFDLDEKINVSTTGEANCGSFWGSPTQEWRLYQNKNGNVIITAASGYELSSVTFKFTVSNNGTLELNDSAITSNTPVALTGSTATFIVGNSSDGSSGQVRITEISVSYGRPLEVSNVALRFGASISQSDWNAINDNNEHPEWEITDYGVMFLKKGTLDNYGFASVEAAFRANDPLKPVTIKHKGSGEAPYLDNGNYLFTIKVSFPDDTSYYDDVICAAPFIKVNDTYYFLEEKQESVNSLAGYYKTHEGSSLSSDALTYLSTAH